MNAGRCRNLPLLTCVIFYGASGLTQGTPLEEAPPAYAKPAFLAATDFATAGDLQLSYHVQPLVSGELVNGWPLLEDVEDQLGEWITQFISAPKIAATITQAMPVEGQPALRKIDEMVTDCCQILHVEKPVIFVRSHPFPQAYVAEAGGKHFLVLTSGLLELYAGAPEEMRFVIGHELGHFKCGHLTSRRAAYGILNAVQTVNLAVVPDEYQTVLPTLGLGRLLSWSREAEISADRAGLLCCQDPQLAYNALLRLLSGIKADSTWVDPSAPNFDANEVIKQFRSWENEPFVDFVMYFKSQSAQSPFIPERVAALKRWAESGAYPSLLERTDATGDSSDQIVVIKSITVHDIASADETADPYVVVHCQERERFRTVSASNRRSVRWREIDEPFHCPDRQPIVCEIWDDDLGSDRLIGGFTIFPVNPEHDEDAGRLQYATSIVWDWKERSSQTRTGLAEVEVEFRERAK